LTEHKVKLDSNNGNIFWSITVQAQRRFQVQGQPWMDDSQSFYLADVEIVEHCQEPPLDLELQQEAHRLSKQIPGLVQEWQRVLASRNKQGDMSHYDAMRPIMPQDLTGRAMWVVACLLNPSLPQHSQKVCLEVRPAMLACNNDFDRISLAVLALQGSIDHLSGKKRLF
jgi:hypothetical protein